MAVPTQLFIDTSVLDGCAYNFESAALKPIVGVAKEKGIVLLLPDVTEQEMLRHIKERSDEALVALSTALQRAPFLARWKDWPLKSKHDLSLSWRLNQMASDELKRFFSLFEVVRLGMSEVNLQEVMEWYGKGSPPFGKGRKKAEFPDAFALQCVLSHCRRSGRAVAVVSMDADFQAACALHEALFCYRSIGSYVESLLLSDGHAEQVRGILDANPELIAARIGEDFAELSFYPTDRDSADLERAEVDEVVFGDLNLTGIGEHEVSVSFEAQVKFSIGASYQEYECFGTHGGEERWAQVTRSDRVNRRAGVTGMAKLTVNEQWTDFQSLDVLTLDDERIGVQAEHDKWEDWGE